MKKSFSKISVLFLALGVNTLCGAQVIVPRTLTMQQVVDLAQEHSITAMNNKNNFAASYWGFRSYKARMLPQLNMTANVGTFNRTLNKVQNYQTGEWSYVADYSMNNDVALNFSQNIPLTGGRISLNTSLSRTDQYNPNRLTTYYSRPVYLSYSQDILGFNEFKWSKQTEPKQYEIAKRQYIENMEQLSQNAIALFWQCVNAKENYERAQKSFEEGKRLYEAGQTRFEMGTITLDQLMQIEVRVLNDSLSLSNSRVSLRTTMNRLCSYIGYQEDTELKLIIDYFIPELVLDYEDVLERALENSSFRLRQEVQYIQSDESVARAKANSGFNATLSATLGLSGTASKFNDAFVELKDQEQVGVRLTIPILDWGQARGNLRMAQAQALTKRNTLEQDMIDYRQDLYTKVMQFNDQRSQCEIAKRAAQLAEDSYELALRNFSSGSMTMSQLDQLKDKRDTALSTYQSKVASFWSYYYDIRRATLYDYITGMDISAEFDELIK